MKNRVPPLTKRNNFNQSIEVIKTTEKSCSNCKGIGKDCKEGGAWIYCTVRNDNDELFDGDSGETLGCSLFTPKQSNRFNLLNKVKDILQKEKGYDFSSEIFDGKVLAILYDAVYATETIVKSNPSQKITAEEILQKHIDAHCFQIKGCHEAVISAIEESLSNRDVVYNNLSESAKPLIKYLCENFHPHVTAIVTPTSVEVLEGKESVSDITEFIVDK